MSGRNIVKHYFHYCLEATYHIGGVAGDPGGVGLGLGVAGRVGRGRGEQVTPVRDVRPSPAPTATAQLGDPAPTARLGLVGGEVAGISRCKKA